MQKDVKMIAKKVIVPPLALIFAFSEFVKIGMFLEFFIYGCFNPDVSSNDIVIFSAMFENQNMIYLPMLFIAIFITVPILTTLLKKDLANKSQFLIILACLPASVLAYLVKAIIDVYMILTIATILELALVAFSIAFIIKAYIKIIKNK